MAQFQCNVKSQGAATHVAMVGAIDEEATIPTMSLDHCKQLDVDLQGVKAINSIGIRIWMTWIKSIQLDKVSLTFHQVPRCLVAQFSMVQGFLPKGAKIATCAVPVYCEKCEKSAEVTLDANYLRALKGTELAGTSIQKSLCNRGDECELAFDISIPKYLGVLNRG